MASLYEYFTKDGATNLTTHEEWHITDKAGNKLEGSATIARMHFDFDAGASYVSFYIPAYDTIKEPEALVLNKLSEVLAWPSTKLSMQGGMWGHLQDAGSLTFSGKIYLYSERPVPELEMDRLNAWARSNGFILVFRSVDFVNYRSKIEKPRAFISHDSRDKKDIAEPIALKLLQLQCPVWYDEFSMKAGDSLRASIENGLKECEKCILVLTPNFLGNSGWTKTEYDSIFTRELIEQKKVILPVWHNVTKKDVFAYSPILADRLGVSWSLGVEEVARKLLRSIEHP